MLASKMGDHKINRLKGAFERLERDFSQEQGGKGQGEMVSS